MEQNEYIKEYLKFKKVCIEEGIFNILEIIKLFEVWLLMNHSI